MYKYLLLIFTLACLLSSKYLYAQTEFSENKIDFSLPVLDVFKEIEDGDEWQESAEKAMA